MQCWLHRLALDVNYIEEVLTFRVSRTILFVIWPDDNFVILVVVLKLTWLLVLSVEIIDMELISSPAWHSLFHRFDSLSAFKTLITSQGCVFTFFFTRSHLVHVSTWSMQLCAWLWTVNFVRETSIHLRHLWYESGMWCNKFDTVFLVEKLELLSLLPSSYCWSKTDVKKKMINNEKLWTRHWTRALKIARTAFTIIKSYKNAYMAS